MEIDKAWSWASNATTRKLQLTITTTAWESIWDFSSTPPCAEKITSALVNFICKYIRPHSVVENRRKVGFRHLVHTPESRYTIQTRTQLSQVIVPKLYSDVKNNVTTALKSTERVAITCNSCRAELWTTPLITLTLTPRAIFYKHGPLKRATPQVILLSCWWKCFECELTDKDPAVITNNVANMVRAVASMGLLLLGCFVHTINLASQAARRTPSVAQLFDQVRQITAFSHRSTMAKHMLKEKQNILTLYSYLNTN